MKYIYENTYINKRTIITVTTIYMFLVLKVRVKGYYFFICAAGDAEYAEPAAQMKKPSEIRGKA